MDNDTSRTNLILRPDQQSIELIEYPPTRPDNATVVSEREDIDLEPLPPSIAGTAKESTATEKVSIAVATLLVAATVGAFFYTIHSLNEQYSGSTAEPVPPD
jgi:hypothetical protein